MTEAYSFQSIKEEIVNSVTHGIGLILSIVGLILMLLIATGADGDIWQIVSVSIYGATLIILYSASTLYHSVQKTEIKSRLNVFDHSAIFLLIAGTYTPFTLITLRGPWGWSILGVIWGFALLGVIMKLFFTGKYVYFSTFLYIAMGWIIVIAGKPLYENLPFDGLIWLIIGGASYSLGVIFYLWKSLPYAHGIFHIFVLGGSIFHFMSIYFYVLQ